METSLSMKNVVKPKPAKKVDKSMYLSKVPAKKTLTQSRSITPSKGPSKTGAKSQSKTPSKILSKSPLKGKDKSSKKEVGRSGLSGVTPRTSVKSSKVVGLTQKRVSVVKDSSKTNKAKKGEKPTSAKEYINQTMSRHQESSYLD
jgi:hypothetical protein